MGGPLSPRTLMVPKMDEPPAQKSLKTLFTPEAPRAGSPELQVLGSWNKPAGALEPEVAPLTVVESFPGKKGKSLV